MTVPVEIRRVLTKAEKDAFIDLAYRLNAGDPNWIPPLKDEVSGLITRRLYQTAADLPRRVEGAAAPAVQDAVAAYLRSRGG